MCADGRACTRVFYSQRPAFRLWELATELTELKFSLSENCMKAPVARNSAKAALFAFVKVFGLCWGAVVNNRTKPGEAGG